jgi:hypothetical protein
MLKQNFQNSKINLIASKLYMFIVFLLYYASRSDHSVFSRLEDIAPFLAVSCRAGIVCPKLQKK